MHRGRKLSAFRGYLIAILLITLAAVVRVILQPALGPRFPFFSFIIGVMIAAWLGGLGPALFALVLGGFAGIYLFGLRPADLILEGINPRLSLGLYVLVGGTAAAIITVLRRERNRANENAEAAEVHLHQLLRHREWAEVTLASIGDGVISTDAEGRINFLNGVAASLTGWDRQDALGRPLAEVFRTVDEETGAISTDPLERILAKGDAMELASHTALLTRTGALIPIDDSGSPVRDTDGNIRGAVLVFRDITARRQAERQLRSAEKRWHQIVETANEGIWLLDSGQRTVYANQRMASMLGYRTSEMMELEYMVFCFPEDLETLRGHVATNLAGGAEQFHFRFRHRDGREVFTLACTSPMRDVRGQITGALGMFSDVTEQRLAQLALQESEQRFREFAETVEDVFWIADEAGESLLYVSPAFERLWGQKPEAVLESRLAWLNQIYEEDRERVRDALIAKAGQGRFDEEYRIIRPDQSIRWVRDRGFPVRDEYGNVLRIVGITEDITERKKFEADLQETAKLESLGVLAGGIAHDFNNLLTGIMGNASLALEELPASSAARELIAGVVHASERAADLTRQMLAYSGKGKFVVQFVNLSAVLREIVGLLRSSISRGIQIELHLRDDLPAVEADVAQIQQLLMNLVINGAEAIGDCPGTITIRIELQHCDEEYVRTTLAGQGLEPGEYVMLQVKDTGCGMDTATQARIFEPFFTTKFTGRGLGLAAARGIVRGHRGAIIVDSAPGRGSTFTVLLPAAKAAVQPRESEKETGSERFEGVILVIDDEEIVRTTAQSALERLGFRVLSAENGLRGIELFESAADEISLVLLDMTMPLMSGEETLRRLRAIRHDVPVIVSSGFSEMEASRRFEGQVLGGFLQKPYTAGYLAEKVRSILLAEKLPPAAAGHC